MKTISLPQMQANLMELPKVSENQLLVLRVLADCYHDERCYLYYRSIAKVTNLPIKKVRIYVRALVRKGLAERSTLFDPDDSRVAGSGHCCSMKGRHVIKLRYTDYEASA